MARPIPLPRGQRLGVRYCEFGWTPAILGTTYHAEDHPPHRDQPRDQWPIRMAYVPPHVFDHTYSTLLRATGADIKVMQELLRHASARVTLDTYTQAITDKKRRAQTKVVRLLVSREKR
jgi:hypothetical protein